MCRHLYYVCLILFRADVFEFADSFDFDFDNVAGLYRADAARCAGRNDIARLERSEATDVRDDARHGEYHL